MFDFLKESEIETKKVYLVKDDEFTDLEKNKLYFKEKGIEVEVVENSRHEIFTLNPSVIAKHVCGFISQVEMMRLEPE